MEMESIPHQRTSTAFMRRNGEDKTEGHSVSLRGKDPLSFVDTKSFWQLLSVCLVFMLLISLWGSPRRQDFGNVSSATSSSSSSPTSSSRLSSALREAEATLGGGAESQAPHTSSDRAIGSLVDNSVPEPLDSDTSNTDSSVSTSSSRSRRPFLSSTSTRVSTLSGDTSSESSSSSENDETSSSSSENDDTASSTSRSSTGELPVIDPAEAYVESQDEEARKAVIAAKCGSWQADYIKLHQDILEGRLPPRYAVSVPPQSGLCDRLVGVMATFLYALVTRRAFQLTNLNLGPFEYGWDAPNINWTRPEDPLAVLRPVDERRHNEDTCTTCPPVIPPELVADKKYGYGYFINDFDLTQEIFQSTDLEGWPNGGEAETVFIASNRGVIPKIFSNDFHTEQFKEWGLEAESAFGCIFDFLFRPNDGVTRLIHEPLRRLKAEPKALTIGLQVRVGDKVFQSDTGAMQDAQDYVKCAKQIEGTRRETESEPVKWFFMSDSLALRDAVKETYGDKVVMLEAGARIEHIRRCTSGETLACSSIEAQRRVVQTAVADLTLFAHTRYQIITHGSSFGRVGAFISAVVHGGAMAVYEIPLVSDCRPESVVDPMDLAARYAGA